MKASQERLRQTSQEHDRFLDGERLNWEEVKTCLGEHITATLQKLSGVLTLHQVDKDNEYSTFWMNLFKIKDPALQEFLQEADEKGDEKTNAYISELRAEVKLLLENIDIGSLIYFHVEHDPKRIPLDMDALDFTTQYRINGLRPQLDWVIANPRNVDTWLQKPEELLGGKCPLDLIKAGDMDPLYELIAKCEEAIARSENFS